MFAALVFDRDPWTWADVVPGVMVWFQVVGGFALFCSILFVLVGWPRYRREDRERIPRLIRLAFVAGNLAGAACYAVAGFFALLGIGREGTDRLGKVALTGH